MIVAPAVDLKGGRCVQLVGGRPDDVRVSLPEPEAAARRWWEMGFGTLHLVDLDAGTSASTAGIVCFEIVGYTVFTPGGGHLLWTDGPYSGMISPVSTWDEVSYCPPFECWHPGVVDVEDRWLVVPRSRGLEKDGTPGPIRMLSFTSLTGGASEVQPFFESTEAYDYDWFEMVRFGGDGDTVVFGHELVPHAEWEWPCPVELMAGFEEEFDIEMDEDAALAVQTVGDAVRFIEQARKEQGKL